MSGAIYPRHLASEVAAALADTPVVVIAGPRQSGKSTLAERIARERGARHVTFDAAAARAAALADPEGFVAADDGPLFIDEFQKVPAILDAIKLRVDRARSAGRDAAGMFLLTGSANVWGTLRIGESLAGRAERITLWPLSQGEIEGVRERFLAELFAGRVPHLHGRPIGRPVVAERMVRGGYPEMVARTTAASRARWARSYAAMVLERDALDIAARAQQLEELPRLLEFSAARVATLVEPTSMGAHIGMKKDSVRRYLHLMELLYLVRRVPAWSANIGQRLIKSPKLWLPDSGLACQLLRYTAERFVDDQTALAGALFENFVAGEIAKQAGFGDAEARLFHFRTAGGREVDIVAERPDGAVVGIEVKLTASPTAADFSGLGHLRDKLGDRFRGGALIHTGADTLPFGDRLWAVPVEGLWAAA